MSFSTTTTPTNTNNRPTTSATLTDEEKKLYRAMKSSLTVENETSEEDDLVAQFSKMSIVQSSVHASVATTEKKKKKKSKKKKQVDKTNDPEEYIPEELGVKGYAHRFGLIEELQNLDNNSKSELESPGKTAGKPQKWVNIRLKATPIEGTPAAAAAAAAKAKAAKLQSATASTSTASFSVDGSYPDDLPPPPPPPRSTSLGIKLSDYTLALGDDHDRLVDYHYRDFIEHFGSKALLGKDGTSTLGDIRQLIDTSVVQLKCMQSALPPARFEAICRLMEQYRGGEVDLETFQRRQEEIFAGEKGASSTLKYFFPMCRKLTLSIPKKVRFLASCTGAKGSPDDDDDDKDDAVAVASTSKDEEKADEGCYVPTPPGEQLFHGALGKVMAEHDNFYASTVSIDESVTVDEEKDLGGECRGRSGSWSPPLPPPPPPPTSTPPKDFPSYVFEQEEKEEEMEKERKKKEEEKEKKDEKKEEEEMPIERQSFMNVLRLLGKVKEHDTGLFLNIIETIVEAFLLGRPQGPLFYSDLAHQVLALLEPHFTLLDDEDILNCFELWL